MKMEFYPTDLAKIIDDKAFELNELEIRFIMKQITEALHYLHSNFILHRDIKPPNVLVDFNGNCVLTDFGLARSIGSPNKELTTGVVTRWYRPPEILFGSRFYGEKVDVWSLGCIFAELILRRPLFQGTSDIDQLSKIFGIRGTPTKKNWPDITKLPCYFEFEEVIEIPLGKILLNCSADVIDLIDSMLQLDPKNRPDLKTVLESELFVISGVEDIKASFEAKIRHHYASMKK